jgi:hypothetical protein
MTKWIPLMTDEHYVLAYSSSRNSYYDADAWDYCLGWMSAVRHCSEWGDQGNGRESNGEKEERLRKELERAGKERIVTCNEQRTMMGANRPGYHYLI